MKRLEGKVALVTGAASGLGAAAARRMHEEGALVVLTDRVVHRGQEVAAALRERARGAARSSTSPAWLG